MLDLLWAATLAAFLLLSVLRADLPPFGPLGVVA